MVIKKKKITVAKNKISRLVREYYYSIFPNKQIFEKMKKLNTLLIETINICNANCIFCGYQYMKRKKQIMNNETFKKTIDDFVMIGGGDIDLRVIVGEPLLDSKFIEHILYARSFSCIKKMTTVTNCLDLHKVGATNLLNSGLNEISISMTGFNVEMYKRIYRNDRYEQMKQNVLDLLRANDKLGRPVKITINLRIDKPMDEVLNYSGFDEVVKLAYSVDAPYYYDSWSGRIKSEDLTGNMKIRSTMFNFIKRKIPCLAIYSGIGILVDGTATVCPCRDLNGDSDLVVGNINNSSLKDIYYSERLEKLRDNWLEGKYIPNICRDCTHYNPYTYMMISEIKKQLT